MVAEDKILSETQRAAMEENRAEPKSNIAEHRRQLEREAEKLQHNTKIEVAE